MTVNRFWQQYLRHRAGQDGQRLRHPGRWPSHPELLDWLATEFVARGWDVKAIQKLIVTGGRLPPGLEGRAAPDRGRPREPPAGPRPAAPARRRGRSATTPWPIAGLLDGRIGGPSVYPYQPPGLWEELAFGGDFSSQKYTPSQGADLYRRGLYTYWKRSLPAPVAVHLRRPQPRGLHGPAAPDQHAAASPGAAERPGLRRGRPGPGPAGPERRRARTARRRLDPCLPALRRPGPRPTASGRSCTGSTPTARPLPGRPKAAEALTASASRPARRLDAGELAAWTAIANVILNLDETITKG